MEIQWKKLLLPSAISGVSFAVGVGAGYILHRNRIRNAMAEIVSDIEEIKSEQLEFNFQRESHAKEFNHQIQQATFVLRELREDGQRFLNKLVDNVTVINEQALDVDKLEPELGVLAHDIISNENPDDYELMLSRARDKEEGWDWEEELAGRSPDRPYIIHKDEYDLNEADYNQISIFYYATDQVLCDEDYKPVNNPERIVGDLKFGHGSRDQSIVYIRNQRLEMDYEILLEPGAFYTELLSDEVERMKENDLKHSVHKFRLD